MPMYNRSHATLFIWVLNIGDSGEFSMNFLSNGNKLLFVRIFFPSVSKLGSTLSHTYVGFNDIIPICIGLCQVPICSYNEILISQVTSLSSMCQDLKRIKSVQHE